MSQLVGGGRPTVLEEAREERLEERAEDDLSTTRSCCQYDVLRASRGSICHTQSGKCHPEDEHKLEDVVEGEPVDGVDSRLNDGKEGVGDPVL